MTTAQRPDRQLPLKLYPPQDQTLEHFIVGANAEAHAQAGALARGESLRPLHLWGGAATGKTHLLAAACAGAAKQGLRPVYLPLKETSHDLDPSVCEGLGTLDLICVDDVDAIGGRGDWELALLRLYNQLADQGGRWLSASTVNPQEAMINLPDLKSRLGWGLVIHLQPLTDDLRREVLMQRARRRGFALSKEVADYLLHRVPRDLKQLCALLDRLDAASLSNQRHVTIPLAKTLLGK
ncbi:MAG TPA: DnaA regulatory inactivator Hda [Gammaproteobacteria bacterium]|nr:DnaA regulatory inactivator Hda [Gammaproteobacteria bacterium]